MAVLLFLDAMRAEAAAARARYVNHATISECDAYALAGMVAALCDRINALEDAAERAAEQFEALADETGCDAGNWDGGSVAACEHCQLLACGAALRAALSGEEPRNAE